MTLPISNRIRSLGVALTLAIVLAVPLPGSGLANQSMAQVSGSWLDEPLVNWNHAGMEIPPPLPRSGVLNPSCASTLRWAQGPEDQALTDVGWSLQAPYLAGWGQTADYAASSYDGMCRPLGYNAFVFLNGVFAGTISPDPMDSRTSGAGTLTGMQNGRVNARYVRYASTDPLCCPSMPAVDVTFEIQSTPDGPVLVPMSKYVEPS